MNIRHTENARSLNQQIKPSYQGKREIVGHAPGLRGLSRFETPKAKPILIVL